jgi:alkylhydroperoxidase/carboxymuconolactone decarboxylase family protein YurZ
VAYIAKHGGLPGRAFRDYVNALLSDDTLTPRERELVFIGVQTALNLEHSLKAHIPRALEAGLTRKELAAAMMIAMANGGVNGALHGLPLLQDEQESS